MEENVLRDVVATSEPTQADISELYFVGSCKFLKSEKPKALAVWTVLKKEENTRRWSWIYGHIHKTQMTEPEASRYQTGKNNAWEQ